VVERTRLPQVGFSLSAEKSALSYIGELQSERSS